MPDTEKIYERIMELRKQIEYHSNAYYNLDTPEIEDDELVVSITLVTVV